MVRAEFFLILALLHAAAAVQLTSVLTPEDAKRLLPYFKPPYNDIDTAYHSIQSLTHYTPGGAIGKPEKEAACKMAKSCDTKSVIELYFASSIIKILGSSCKHEYSKETLDFVKSQLNEKLDSLHLFSVVSTLYNLKQKVDEATITNLLLDALKEDNKILPSSFMLLAASKLSNQNMAKVVKAADIEDMAAQADEVNGRYLHFNNDLNTLSVFLMGVFSVSESSKQAPLLSDEQIVLFVNYLMRSKSAVSTNIDATLVVIPLGMMVASPFTKVAKVDILSGNSVSQENSQISISVSDLFGRPMTKLNVKAETVTRSSDDEVILSNTAMKCDGVKAYNLAFWKNSLKSGFYDVSLNVASPGTKLIGGSDIQFKVKVTTKIALVNVELGTAERESVGGSLKKVDFLKKADQLKADSQQKIVMKFQVQSLSDKSLQSPHQAFVRFLNEKSGQEVIFVAEPDKDLTFKFEVDLTTGGREQFNSVSGKYSMHLIIGDVSISNPVFWNFGDAILQLTDEVQKPKASFEEQYARKPEIHHIFRQPEKRPPAIVSQAFTIACLAPLLVLFVLWARIGANFGGFRLSLKSIIFHAGMAGIFVLYYLFWTKLNMFTTVQYLCVVGLVTFVFGNSVLSDLANNR